MSTVSESGSDDVTDLQPPQPTSEQATPTPHHPTTASPDGAHGALPAVHQVPAALERYFRGAYPVFATNRPEQGLRVADAINRMFSTAVEELKTPPSAAIAAPYINPAGFDMIAASLSGYDKVRLLIGAEPEPSDQGRFDAARVKDALVALDRWIAAERDLTGFTYNDDRVSRQLVDWLRSKTPGGGSRVEVRRLAERFLHGKAFIVEHPVSPAVLAGSSNLTAAGLCANAELNIGYPASENCELVQEWFDELWGQAEPYPLADIYGARFQEHDPQTIFERMLLAVYGSVDAAAEDLGDELGLTVFQAEGVSRLLRFINDLGGALLADEPGLGKTYMAGEIARRYARTGRKVLIVAPAAVRDSVWEPWLRHQGISRRVSVMSYTEARLAYEHLMSEGAEPSPEQLDQAFGDYQLVIADEAHHLRNAGTRQHDAVTEITTAGARKDILLVTATPINNSLRDLEHLLGLFLVSDDALAAKGIASWSRKVREAIQMEERDDAVPEGFLYDLLDQVTVRRSRQFILDHPAAEGDTIRGVDGAEQRVRFPSVDLRPRIQWDLGARTKLVDALMAHLDEDLAAQADDDAPALTFARYDLSGFSLDEDERSALGRDRVALMRCSILKRLESSPWAITRTLKRLADNYQWFLAELDDGRVYTVKEMHLILRSPDIASDGDPADLEDLEELRDGDSGAGDQLGRPVADFDAANLAAASRDDLVVLGNLLAEAEKITGPAADAYTGAGTGDDKILRLVERLRAIARAGAKHRDRRKAIIFTEFADTAQYVHAALTAAVDAAGDDDPLISYRGRVAEAIRSTEGASDHRDHTIASFAPKTTGTPTSKDLYDILITTDVLAEGVNLHQAGRVINYDLPWNPMRLVQRHGRVDRIGSAHTRVEIDVFAPAARLDAMLKLMAKIEKKLGLAHAALGVPETIADMPGGGQGQLFRDGPDGLEVAAGILDGDDRWLTRRGSDTTSLGERWRMALTRMQDPQAVARLPIAAGSGFISHEVRVPGFVFCAEITHGDETHTQMVSVTAALQTWQPTGVFDTSTLNCLRAADPHGAPRRVDSNVYPAVYTAWEQCRHHIVEQNAKALQEAADLRLPKPMRDAKTIIQRSSSLGAHQKERLVGAYNTMPSRMVQNRVRTALRRASDETPDRAAERLAVLADRLGLSAQTARSASPRPITAEQVRPIAWLAIEPAAS